MIMNKITFFASVLLSTATLYGAQSTELLIHADSRKVIAPFDALQYDRSRNVYDRQYYVGNPEQLVVVTVEDYAEEKLIPVGGLVTISSECTLVEALAASDAVVDTLIDATWAIADAYGVTNSPLNWFTLDATLDAATSSTNDMVAFTALKAAVRLDKNAMFLKEWGVDLFNITR